LPLPINPDIAGTETLHFDCGFNKMKMQRLYLGVSVMLTLLLAWQTVLYESALLLIPIGALLGMAFHHAGFGFTGAYRMMMEGTGSGWCRRNCCCWR